MKKSLNLKIVLVALALPLSANAASLCGREYETPKSLVTQLKSDVNVKAFPGRRSTSVYFDSKSMTLWWARNVRDRLLIITCKQKVRSDKGYVDGGVQADCNQDRSRACVEQTKAMTQAKF